MSAEAAPAKPPRGSRRTLVTPEGVDLGVELAPLSARFAALVIDLTILGLTFLLGGWLISFLFRASPLRPQPEVVQILALLAMFFLRNAWFVIWEIRPPGATPGKRVMQIRVAMRNGGRLTADAVFARNVARELELFLPLWGLVSATFSASFGAFGAWTALALVIWSFIFALLPFFNRDRLRAGDLLAGTWVVQAPRHALKPDLTQGAAARAQRFDFTRQQLDAYGVMELQVLEQVLRQMEKAVLRDVATRIREKIGWTSAPDENDADFLKAYYAALRDRLEKRMLFGHRRRDKHDRAGLN
jgi:uncharacterized RDD family membrane protein YckC